MADDFIITCWIDEARKSTQNQTDAETITQLEAWQSEVFADYQSGVQITQVTFSGESQSGQAQLSPREALVQIRQALGKLNADGTYGSDGVIEPRAPGYVRT